MTSSTPSALDLGVLERIAAHRPFSFNMSGIAARDLQAQGYVKVVVDHGGAQVAVRLTVAGAAAVEAAAQGA